MGITAIVPFGVGLLLLYLAGKALFVPYKFIFKLVINGLLGGLLLWTINFLGSSWGLTLAINPITALIAGFLGMPGIVLLLLLKHLVL